ncbi:uncharacterized protein N7446_002295 [Penicillium canescens]|uniref:2'-phosphotransferase n=1 Tax=Penicillium canescens TaxID=5083 RepID=A0AAD6IFL6_PENCN|nr:uncharacterized protein N7446_002295 [Penicillium canescens]KAJ6044099.1 hypothetical protein N7460_005454 [Penicillium canescens]KAJ6055570.1 hypothetical protein N7444_004668 [Penicillium canescens]KAJ6074518.1 hypothetical protein N7446_002295 [Penicillium canescens]
MSGAYYAIKYLGVDCQSRIPYRPTSNYSRLFCFSPHTPHLQDIMPGKDRRPRGQGQGQSRDVQVSKALSLLLRHAAEKEGLKMNEQGYASVTDVLEWRKLKSLKVTFPEILHAVDSSDKKRFALLHIPSAQTTESTTQATTVPVTGPNAEHEAAKVASEDQPSTTVLESAPATSDAQQTATDQALAVNDTDPSHFLIRATQGHSIKTVDAASFLEPLSLADETKLPDTVVHGTFHSTWPVILQSGGLRCMGRNHVHFATGPSLEAVLAQDKDAVQAKRASGEAHVISGMRRDAQVLIYIDIRKALAAGVPFWRSENGVILSEGIPVPTEGEKGEPAKFVSLDFFDVVAERKVGLGKLWERGQVLQELPEHLTKKGNPKGRR